MRSWHRKRILQAGFFQIFAAIVSVVSAIASGVAQHQQAKQAKKQADIQAKAAADQAAYEQSQHQRETAQLLASQRAAFAAMGMDLGDEDATPMTVLNQTGVDRADEFRHLQQGGWSTVEAYKAKSDAYGDAASMSLLTGVVGAAGAAAKGYDKYKASKPGVIE